MKLKRSDQRSLMMICEFAKRFRINYFTHTQSANTLAVFISVHRVTET